MSVINLRSIQSTCGSCGVRQLCLPLSLEGADVDRLDAIVKRRKPLRRGDHLFWAGEPFKSIYAVRSGAVKTYIVAEDGQDHITGFHLASEILGLDAISTNKHACSAKALETTSVCEIPFERLEEVGQQIPGLMSRLVRIMSQELHQEDEQLLTLAKRTAEERVATLLYNVSTRLQQRGLSAVSFSLPMARADIASYLGLAVETVSRIFSRFQESGLLSVSGRDVEIPSLASLRAVAGMCDRPAQTDKVCG
jgi:CRP/FNR family transcriptional regulator, anaerobic regulatory protein